MTKTFSTAELTEILPSLQRFAMSLTRNEDRANDLVQDSIERALLKADLYTPGTNLRSWMFTLCKRVFLNQIRREKSRGHNVELSDVPQAKVSEEASQEKTIEWRETSACFERLPAADKSVLSLVAVNGMKYEEAAEELDVPVGTIRSRLFRARERLKAMTDTGTSSPLPSAA